MSWRVADSLIRLRDQVNELSPNRNKASDGTIGDAAHQAEGSASDHNPNSAGVVTAMDITNDPSQGVDVQKIADYIAASQDPRVKYMIFNDRIMIPSDYGWRWVAHYIGSHRQHLHVSVWGNYDDKSDWNIGLIKEEDVLKPSEAEIVDTFEMYLLEKPKNREQIQYYLNQDVRVLYRDVLGATKPSRGEIEKAFSELLPGTSDPNRIPYYSTRNSKQLYMDIAGTLKKELNASPEDIKTKLSQAKKLGRQIADI